MNGECTCGQGSLCLPLELGGSSSDIFFCEFRARPSQGASRSEANIDAVLTEELLQFQFPNDANTIGIPESQPQGLYPYVIGRTAIFCCEEDDSFKDSSGADFPCWKEGGCEAAETSLLRPSLGSCPDLRFIRAVTNSGG